MLIEQLEYDLLFRWFVGLAMDAGLWVQTTLTKNLARLLEGEIAARFFDAVRRQAETARLLSDKHFPGWPAVADEGEPQARGADRRGPVSPGGGSNIEVNFRGQRRGKETRSTTDPEAHLVRKGDRPAAVLGYSPHVRLDERHGLVRNACASPATGTAEAEPGTLLVQPTVRPGNTSYRARTTRHPGDVVSKHKRTLVEQVFGWMKMVGGLRQVKLRGERMVDWHVTFAATAYNLLRLRTLGVAPA